MSVDPDDPTVMLTPLQVLTRRVDALQQAQAGFTQVAADVSATAQRVSGIADADAAAVTRIGAALTAMSVRRPRTAPAVPVPAVASVVSGPVAVDVAVTWSVPWPDTSYDALPVLDLPAALLGKVSVTVKSKASDSAVLTVTTTAVIVAGTATVRAVSVSTS